MWYNIIVDITQVTKYCTFIYQRLLFTMAYLVSPQNGIQTLGDSSVYSGWRYDHILRYETFLII